VLLLRLADAYLRVNDILNARKTIEEGLGLGVYRPQFFSVLAATEERTGNYRAAIIALEGALSHLHGPKNEGPIADCLSHASRLSIQMGDIQKGVAFAERAMEIYEIRRDGRADHLRDVVGYWKQRK
jgi:tetratricopeptide (TPR) repeat protein